MMYKTDEQLELESLLDSWEARKCTGRSERLAREAVRAAANGAHVCVLAATSTQLSVLYEQVQAACEAEGCDWRSSGTKRYAINILGAGSLTVLVYSPMAPLRSGVKVMADHYVFEYHAKQILGSLRDR